MVAVSLKKKTKIKPKRRGAPNTTNRKEEIILATLELAAEKGLAGVSMSMIADKIGIKKPSLYKHFSSKDEIVEAMYQFLREQSKKNANIKPVDFSQLFQGKTAYEVLQGVVQGLMIIILCTCISAAYHP